MEFFHFFKDLDIPLLIRHYGYSVVGGGILIECMGVPFPGEMTLILAGVAASLGHLNLAIVILVAAIAAVVGDNLGYMIGKKFGRKVIKKFEHFPLFHYKHISRVETFFKKHGNKTVFIGRFIPVVRTYAAVFAGIFDMHYATFFIYNLTGGVTWAIVFGIFGYVLGNNIPLIKFVLMKFNLALILLVAAFIIYKVSRHFLQKENTQKNEES